MNLKKEEVYLKITDSTQVSKVTELLDKFGEKKFSNIDVEGVDFWGYGYTPDDDVWQGINLRHYSGRTEVTIEQLEEILRPKEMKSQFEAGDYIVTLDVTSYIWNCGKKNYCFKIRSTATYIMPEVDLKGSTTNGHPIMSFDKQQDLKDWRYATPEEIAEYNKQGKPFDVTTLKNTRIMKNQSVTRQDLQTLYNAACSQWKATITDYANRISPFENSLELTAEEITAIFEASSTSQKEVLNSVGLVEPVPESTNAFTRNLTREDIRGIADAMDNVVFDVVNGYADCIGREDLRYKSLLVSHEVEVILHNSDGRTIIEFKKKQEL